MSRSQIWDGSQWISMTSGTSEGAGAGIVVSALSADATLSASGIYIVDTSGGNIAVTLPLISNAGSDGFAITIKRDGSNFVDVFAQGPDDIEPTGLNSLRLFTNWSALKLAVAPSGAYWSQLGFYGGMITT